MRISGRTWLIASVILGLVFTIPSNATFAAGELCLPSATLTQGVSDQLSAPTGVELKTWRFASNIANNSVYPTLLAMVRSSGVNTTIKPAMAKVGDSARQKDLALAAGALAYVNGNYYDFSTFQPEGPIGINGKYLFTKPGISRAVGLEVRSASASTGISGSGFIKQGSRKIALTGLNLGWLKANSLSAYTSAYSSTALPRNGYAILISNGLVASKNAHGIKNRPSAGTVVVASGKAITKLKAFVKSRSVQLVLPTGTYVQPRRDLVTPNLSLTGTATTIPIQAMNYLTANGDANLVIYDSHWSGSAPSSPATIALSSSGAVTSVTTQYFSGSVPSGGYLVKAFTAQGLAQLSGIQVGTKFAVNLGWSANTGKSYQSLFSYHNLLVSSGANVALCTSGAEVIRPRTAIGWNETGKLIMLTSTMGKHWDDGGYRLGGATLHQMGDWLVALGATGGVGLDGGGSTTMYVKRSGVYDRIDLPDTEWVRSVPQGIALTNR